MKLIKCAHLGFTANLAGMMSFYVGFIRRCNEFCGFFSKPETACLTNAYDRSGKYDFEVCFHVNVED